MPILYKKSYEVTFPWAEEAPGDKYAARCKWCNSAAFTIASMGKAAFRSHEKSMKHSQVAAARQSTAPLLFSPGKGPFPSSAVRASLEDPNENPDDAPPMSVTPNEASSGKHSAPPVVAASSASGSVRPGVMERFLLAENVTKAEIIWALHVSSTHMSNRKGASSVPVFKIMFTDSDIAQKMSIDRTKLGYVLTFGLGPYFESELRRSISQCSEIVVGFDESLNEVSKKEQLDIHVWYWPEGSKQVQGRYLTSMFPRSCRACDIIDALRSALLDLVGKTIQLSMDGPNVNVKIQRDMSTELKALLNRDGFELLNIGSCGLHVLHGAFAVGMKASGWKLEQFFKAIYGIFKKNPLRCKEYEVTTGSAVYALKFCGVRWVENRDVCMRAQEMLPHLQTYVKAVENQVSSGMKASHPDFKRSFALARKSYYYGFVEEGSKDRLLGPKLAFFHSTASLVEPFLTAFQSAAPMSPFLYDDVLHVVKTLLRKFVKPEYLKEDKALIKLDLTDTKVLLTANELDLGFAVKAALRVALAAKKVSDKEISLFRNECRTAYIKMASKVFERSPLSYPFTRYISCLSPEVISRNASAASKRMEFALDHLVTKGHMVGSVADSVKIEYDELLKASGVASAMKEYRRSERLDEFWMKIMDGSGKNCSNLVIFVRKILLLSHGNASLERGFSVNKECVVVHQKDESLVAQRLVHDAVHVAGGVEATEVSKSMILSVRNAYAKYKESLKKKKDDQSEEEKKKMLKRKQDAELKELQVKKAQIVKEADAQVSLLDEQMKDLAKKK